MKYYVAKGPIKELGYEWEISFYKMEPNGVADVIRIKDDVITIDHIIHLNFWYVKKHCKEITKEEYESMITYKPE